MPKDSSSSIAPALSRRTVFMGAGVAGAVGAIAAVAAGSKIQPAPAPAVEAAETADGYQLTEHVKQYYATARI
ncbi:MAG: formate dehydrogenase [Rubrivivax sp.]|nr:formate dehydrogenase [Rubrivivax sp.]